MRKARVYKDCKDSILVLFMKNNNAVGFATFEGDDMSLDAWKTYWKYIIRAEFPEGYISV